MLSIIHQLSGRANSLLPNSGRILLIICPWVYTPFKALYGYDPHITTLPNVESAVDLSVQELLANRQAHMEFLKQHLAAAQNKIKHQAEKHRTGREFQVGD